MNYIYRIIVVVWEKLFKLRYRIKSGVKRSHITWINNYQSGIEPIYCKEYKRRKLNK